MFSIIYKLFKKKEKDYWWKDCPNCGKHKLIYVPIKIFGKPIVICENCNWEDYAIYHCTNSETRKNPEYLNNGDPKKKQKPN